MNSLENVIVVGGAGAVGTMFIDLLTAAGLRTTLVDLPGIAHSAPDRGSYDVIEGDVLQAGPPLRAALADADVVLLALPEDVACAAIPVLVPMLKPGALLADTVSVKTNLAATWTSIEADVEAVSLNPMFAPSLGVRGRPIAAVMLRDGPKAQAFVTMMQNWGADVVVMDADEHDEATASMQALTHASILGFGLALREIDTDPARLARIAPPPFHAMLALLARIAGGTSEVYWDIQDANPNAPAAREALAAGVRKLNDAVAQGEQSFAQMFAEIADYAGSTLAGHREHCQVMFEALGVNEQRIREGVSND